jgi:hypothetical protein
MSIPSTASQALESTGLLEKADQIRIGLAAALLLSGFGLATYGWMGGNEHVYHLGLALGPAGLVVVVFEYLVRISLDARHLREMGGIRAETIRQLQDTAEKLRERATFDLDRGQLGLVGIYANRADAVAYAISNMIESEREGIYIVGSTIFGLNCDARHDPPRPQLECEDIVKRIAQKHNAGCEVRILLTDPVRVSERHDQEAAARSADRGTIASELRKACRLLMDHGLADCVKLYNATPTCFTMVFKSQRRMVVNPYPYEGEAYKSWAIMIEDRENGIYQPFLQSHVEKPWSNERLARPLTRDLPEQLRHAEERERKFAEDAERQQASEAAKIDALLATQLPPDVVGT